MFNFFNELISDYGLEVPLNKFNLINLSNKLIYVEGHLGVISIELNMISFRVKKGVIVVNGNNLSIKQISNKTLTIIGEIKSIESY